MYCFAQYDSTSRPLQSAWHNSKVAYFQRELYEELSVSDRLCNSTRLVLKKISNYRNFTGRFFIVCIAKVVLHSCNLVIELYFGV